MIKKWNNIASEEVFDKLQQIEEDLLVYFQYPDKGLINLIKLDLNVIQMDFEYFEIEELNLVTKDLQNNLHFLSHALIELTIEEVQLCFEELHQLEKLVIDLEFK
jgi:hypothetical protein